ncbi:MAG TPA: ATP-binding protein [Bacteroidia bacterium]|nr:ATP-binding protein [Bacteroidia bacterium]
MSETQNPFPVNGYFGAELFCDREEETKRLVSNARNGVNTTLMAVRRMGKTGLILHALASLERSRSTVCIYADVYATSSLKDFVNVLAAAILKTFPEKKSIGKKFMTLLKSLRPVLSFDALTGEPEVSFDFADPKQYHHSLQSLFSFLEKQKVKIILAIDEFQQVSVYPEQNTEARLRTIIQSLRNVQFIFSGSSPHLLHEMFSNSKRPFFSSTQPLYLGSIRREKYAAFIVQQFARHRRKIRPDALEFILSWSRLHTYYTQALCNRVFASGERDVNRETVNRACAELLGEQEMYFFQYRNLLTQAQWNLLTAIAKEERVYQPSAQNFIHRHRLGTPSNVQRSLEALLAKEMIFRDKDAQGAYYTVYDCFLARWLEKN